MRIPNTICSIIAAIAAGLLSLPASATPIVGGKIGIGSVGSPSPLSQEASAVAAGGSGYLVVWQDHRSDSEYDIYGTLVNAAGQPTSSEAFPICSASGDQMNPAVAYNGTDFLVVWEDYGSGTAHVRGARVTTSGTVRDPAGIAISGTSTHQANPAVAANGSGSWEVVWEEYTATDPQVYGVQVSGAGVTGTPSYLTTGSAAHRGPAVAWNGANFLLAWEDYTNSEFTGADIRGVLLDSAGAKVSAFDILISSATGSSSSGAPGAQTAPQVAAGIGGDWLVVWTDARGTSRDVYGARVSGGGGLYDMGGIPIGTGTLDQESASVGWDGTDYLVAWRDKANYRTATASRVGADGSVIDATPVQVSSGAIGSLGPSIASRTGTSLIVWYTLSLNDADVYAATATTSGPTIGLGAETLLTVTKQDQPCYDAVYDGTKFVAVWSDKRSGSYSIYASRISKRGVVTDPQGVLIASSTTTDLSHPAIAWSGSNYLVVWTENKDTLADVKGRLLDTNLNLIGSQIDICTQLLGQDYPAVAYGGGYYLVVWVDSRYAEPPNQYTDLFGARISTTGALYPLDTAVSLAGGSQYAPQIAANDGQDFLVVWEDYRNTSPSIYCTRVTCTGTVASALGTQVSSTVSDKHSPVAAFDGTNYLVAWSDNRNGTGLTSDIYGARLSSSAVRLDATDVPICTSADDQLLPAIAWTGDSYYVSWEDYRNSATTGADVYLTRVSRYGSIIDPGGILVAGATNPELKPVVASSGADTAYMFYSDLIDATHRLVARSCGETSATSVPTIFAAKGYTDGTRVLLSAKIATAGTDQIPGVFYIEEANRTSGIRVVSADPVREGNVVDVTGAITTVDGEREIAATSVRIAAQPGTVPTPVGTGVAHLGGTALNAYTPGVRNGRGPNNIGLLVTCWGKVTTTGSGFFYIKDGVLAPKSGQQPAAPIEAKVICCAGVAPPAAGTFVSVTGISSCEPSGTDSVRRVIMRKASDLIVR